MCTALREQGPVWLPFVSFNGQHERSIEVGGRSSSGALRLRVERPSMTCPHFDDLCVITVALIPATCAALRRRYAGFGAVLGSGVGAEGRWIVTSKVWPPAEGLNAPCLHLSLHLSPDHTGPGT